MDPLANYTDETAALIEKSPGLQLPLRIPGQNFALINVGHRELSIHSDSAAFRILGFFETVQDAVSHFQKQKCLQKTETGVHRSHAWKLIAPKKPESVAKEVRRVGEILNSNRAKNEADKKEFLSRKSGEVSKKSIEDQLGLNEPDPITHSKADSKTDLIEHNAPQAVELEVPSQKYAAVGLVRGDLDDATVCFFGAFSVETEARRYIRDTLSEEYDEFEIFVVDMYRFVYVNDAFKTDTSAVGFRHKYLDDVWAQRRADNNAAMRYKKKYEKENKKALEFKVVPTGEKESEALVPLSNPVSDLAASK